MCNGNMLISVHYKVKVCCNPSLGFATKAKRLARLQIKRKPGSVGKCEGMNPHTPKATPILGDRVPVDSPIFRRRL